MEFFHSYIDSKCESLLLSVLQSGFVSEGSVTARFEHELMVRLNLIRPVAVNSGTSALHLALAVAGVGPGDEVVVPAQTFVATALAVQMCGATPVFGDVSAVDGNLTADGLREVLTERTKAVIPVHWSGYPCDMDALNDVAGAAGIVIVEDAAHALGATYRGRPIGAISRFTAFSFQAIKHLTTGDGGALCCADTDDEEWARRLRWFGIDRSSREPSMLGERHYLLTRMGFKYHLNNVAAAIGLGNLATFNERLDRHRAIDWRYREGIRTGHGSTITSRDPNRQSSCWFFPLLVDDRDAFARAMNDRGVPVSVVHRRIDRHPLFSSNRRELPGQSEFDEKQINLPIHVGLTDDDVERVVAAVNAGW